MRGGGIFGSKRTNAVEVEGVADGVVGGEGRCGVSEVVVELEAGEGAVTFFSSIFVSGEGESEIVRVSVGAWMDATGWLRMTEEGVMVSAEAERGMGDGRGGASDVLLLAGSGGEEEGEEEEVVRKDALCALTASNSLLTTSRAYRSLETLVGSLPLLLLSLSPERPERRRFLSATLEVARNRFLASLSSLRMNANTSFRAFDNVTDSRNRCTY